jgi:tartrate dehydratase beta subunit/fumarate hydratase class I family protein
MTKLTFPFTEEKIRALKVGDEVLISGGGRAGNQNPVALGQIAA